MAARRSQFVEDYQKFVRDLLTRYALPEAMSHAVGGDFKLIGEIEKQLLIGYGLKPEHTLVDVGCGSGRLAKQLVTYLGSGRVLGTDVVPELLEYARTGCPSNWQFALVDDIRIPFSNDEADFASFFSVFTHLLHEESFCYLIEARRVVKPGGLIVFSFLEFGSNWEIFSGAVRLLRKGEPNPILNVFIARDAIEIWARQLQMPVVEIRAGPDRFINLPTPVLADSGEWIEGSVALGQSVCVLRNEKVPRRSRKILWESATSPVMEQSPI